MYAIRKTAETVVFSANPPSDDIRLGLIKAHGADAEVYRLTSDADHNAIKALLSQHEAGHSEETPAPSTKRLGLADDNAAIYVLSEGDEVLGSWPAERVSLN